MKGYAAEINGDAIFLTKDTQLDTALKNGCNIVRIEDDDGQTIIATPENGFLEDRPTLEETGTMTNPYAEALAMLEKGENTNGRYHNHTKDHDRT